MALQNQFGALSLDASTLAVRDVLATGVTHNDLAAILAALVTGAAHTDSVNLLNKLGVSDPDGTLNASVDPSSLLLDGFDAAITTNWTTGGTAPTVAGSQATFASTTTASGSSFIRTNGAFLVRAQAYLRSSMHVQHDPSSAAITNSSRWWGIGTNQGTPTAANPVLNGAVFILDYVDGALYAATYNAGAQTKVATLTKPSDGAFHKYEVWYRQSVVYWVIDNVVVATRTQPSFGVFQSPYMIGGSVNHTTAPGTAPRLILGGASIGDSGGNTKAIGDGVTPWIQASVRAGSSAAASTDSALVTVVRDAVAVSSIASSVTPGTGSSNLGKARNGTPGTTDVGVQMLGIRAPATPATLNSAGLYVPPLLDTEGKFIPAGTGDSAQTWQGNVTQASTTAAAIKAAGAAGIRNYMTDLSISNSSATATTVQILDGATVIWQQALPANGQIHRSFNTPLRGTAATAMNVNLGTAVTSVYFSAEGYVGV